MFQGPSRQLVRPTPGSAYVGPQQERGCTGNAGDEKTEEEVPQSRKLCVVFFFETTYEQQRASKINVI